MKLRASILFTDKFDFDGKKYVKIQALANGKGVFQTTVKEELVPDKIEGKTVDFDIGFDQKLKPYLKIIGLQLI